MLTKKERREKARRYYVSTYGEQQGTEMWEDYCRKSGLLPAKPAKNETGEEEDPGEGK